MRRTKILATLGPASAEPDVLGRMLDAGLDAVRLNFSHGTHESHAAALRHVRATAEARGRAVAVLQDLQGPKIRVGLVKGQMELVAGSRLTITTRAVLGEGGVVSTTYQHLPTDVARGDRILLDEGRLTVEVREVTGTDVVTEVVDGGALSSHKGINLPGAALTAASMTDKDIVDVRFALGLGIDYVALSMVRRAQDVRDLRELMAAEGHRVPIVAKIEKPQAVAALDEILEAADGVMVARGDLGIEMELDRMPAYQKQIIAAANRAGKLVITATQMLESMTENAVPTRAEVTDVANAVLDGTDAVMLSGETAVGRHPVETVRRMAAICEATEENLYRFGETVRPAAGGDHAALIARLAAEAGNRAGARAVVVQTRTGETARRVSDERPRAPIVALVPDQAVQRQLALYWGVRPSVAPRPLDLSHLPVDAAPRAGEVVVVVQGSNTDPDATYGIKLVTG
jgi:pyruvate kinase